MQMHRRKISAKTRLRYRRAAALFAVAAVIIVLLLRMGIYLRKTSAQIALSDASDLVTLRINKAIADIMGSGEYDYDYFAELEKDEDGRVSAIMTNMTRINALSSQILSNVVESNNGGELTVSLPLGNLLGSSLLSGRGPEIPVRIIMLTSSHAEFDNELVSAGINQTKHQIVLKVTVNIDVLVPWDTLSTQVEERVLVAETIIVGSVPDTYLDLGSNDGTTE